jgi:hypothetical protein
MGEWLKPAVLKTVSGVTRSGVRIPLPPFHSRHLFSNYLTGFLSVHRVGIPCVRAWQLGKGQRLGRFMLLEPFLKTIIEPTSAPQSEGFVSLGVHK